MQYDLDRYIKAQQRDYETALSEIKSGRKRSHWMWYIFPQVAGLGYSEMSRHYGIENLGEAQAYLEHVVLGNRLIEICRELLKSKNQNVSQVFGSPDDMKLKSSMTLFSVVPNTNPVFQDVLDRFFDGRADSATLRILNIK